jgi:lysophospholipase L1-like esterase
LLQTAWTILGITLILVILMDTGFRVVFALWDQASAIPQPDPRVLAEGYGGAAWPVQHYRELASIQERWQPFVYFRQKPFLGQTIAIDADGLRANWEPPWVPDARDERKVIKLLMLGGSALWGFGARNEQTIPSLLARDLHERGTRVKLTNLAEMGYVSTQEVIALFRELQSGNRPDVVIFYDGWNDTASALLDGEAGVTTNEVNRRQEFNLSRSPAELTAALIINVVKDSGSYRFARTVGRRLLGENQRPGASASNKQIPQLADAVVRRYEANVQIVEALGRAFGFRPIFYWQPTVFTKRALTAFEREETARFAWSEPMFRQVYAAIGSWDRRPAGAAFHDLSRMFEDTQNLVFIDYCHTTEAANARIAAVMAGDVLAALHPSASKGLKPQR